MVEPADVTANRNDGRRDGRRDADDDDRPTDSADAAAIEDRLADAESRLDELEAATQALRGYVGGVRAVNREIEHRADAALAAVERLERDGRRSEPSGERGSRCVADGDGPAHRGGTADAGIPDAEATDDDVDSAVGSSEDPEPPGIATRLRDVL